MRLEKAATIGLALALVPSAVLAGNGSSGGSGLSSPNRTLWRPDGDSELAITIGRDGTMIAGALSWQLFQTNLWKGSFGSTPIFQGAPDANLEPGVGGGGDEDWDLASNGTLHGTTLIFFFNPKTKITQLGVSAISCPHADTSNNFANCTSRIIDTTQADRQWVTSLGSTVWISYHDSGSSTLIHVQRSTDDGNTWPSRPTTGRPGPRRRSAAAVERRPRSFRRSPPATASSTFPITAAPPPASRTRPRSGTSFWRRAPTQARATSKRRSRISPTTWA